MSMGFPPSGVGGGVVEGTFQGGRHSDRFRIALFQREVTKLPQRPSTLK